ncbi:carboxypeptidase-like regulatory domain-containing protein [Mesonia sp.]|uniref:carboxypeptidase-like regulatory domain-containing protein n=1 Tax=Mesonia sp. TaxID=1960830 RepID=UPI001751B2D2|nr:carboxypeptidase-like regulatory domain-containing protein [Mesonia sp.]HIB37110.1 carboxypeptidase-like regulatory domain-containing protein [Mesonia sp.]
MKNYKNTTTPLKILVLIFILFNFTANAQDKSESNNFVEYKGKVIDAETEAILPSAHLRIKNSNISTITNNEGEFSLKVPSSQLDAVVTITLLGYKSKSIHLNYFDKNFTVLTLSSESEQLSAVEVFTAIDAKKVVKQTLENKGDNYLNEPTLLTAFYRESIQQRNKHVSLSEAVVNIEKQPYNSNREDRVSLYKARKSSDYTNLDTLAVKLKGGPFGPLYVDIMKYPDFLFYKSTLEGFVFNFDDPTKLDGRYLYVINFKEINTNEPWYFGKLYIDAKSLTLVKADYSLNVDNRKAAQKMFVKKKPGSAKVFPIETSYQIDYTENNGKWYYSYSNAYMKFVVNWKNKLFNSRYDFNSEMIVTNRKPYEENWKSNNKLIRPSIVMVDDVSGFYDMNFWGENNIIEPNETIQEAIEKIQEKIQ